MFKQKITHKKIQKQKMYCKCYFFYTKEKNVIMFDFCLVYKRLTAVLQSKYSCNDYSINVSECITNVLLLKILVFVKVNKYGVG